MKNFFALVFAALLLVGCGENEPPKRATINVEGTFGKNQAEAIQKALAAFKVACKPLFSDYWGDVASATALVGPEIVSGGASTWRHDKFGWQQSIQLEILLKGKLAAVPEAFHADGHTLYYYLGGGDQPGMVVEKAQSARVCGFTVDPAGNDLFVANSAFAVTDTLAQ